MHVRSHRESIIAQMTGVSLLTGLFSILALAEYGSNSEERVAKRWRDTFSVTIPVAIFTSLIAWSMHHNHKYHPRVSVPV